MFYPVYFNPLLAVALALITPAVSLIAIIGFVRFTCMKMYKKDALPDAGFSDLVVKCDPVFDSHDKITKYNLKDLDTYTACCLDISPKNLVNGSFLVSKRWVTKHGGVYKDSELRFLMFGSRVVNKSMVRQCIACSEIRDSSKLGKLFRIFLNLCTGVTVVYIGKRDLSKIAIKEDLDDIPDLDVTSTELGVDSRVATELDFAVDSKNSAVDSAVDSKNSTADSAVDSKSTRKSVSSRALTMNMLCPDVSIYDVFAYSAMAYALTLCMMGVLVGVIAYVFYFAPIFIFCIWIGAIFVGYIDLIQYAVYIRTIE